MKTLFTFSLTAALALLVGCSNTQAPTETGSVDAAARNDAQPVASTGKTCVRNLALVPVGRENAAPVDPGVTCY